jgi:hypothetical protein
VISSYRHWADYEKIDRKEISALCQRVREAGMVLCPTLIVMDRIGKMTDPSTKAGPLLQYVPESMRRFWEGGTYSAGMAQSMREALPFQKALVKDMHDAGVTILCGTDLANPYVVAGFAVHDEMALLQEAGIAAPAVLKTATVDAAEFCGVGDRLGAVAQGKTASLCLVGRDPLADVRHARDLHGVFLRGRWLDRAALDGVLEAVKAKVAAGTAPAPAAVEDAAAAAELELPGEVVARGRFTSTFNGQAADRESYLITKTDTGYHVAAENTPSSSFSLPSRTVLEYGPDFAPRGGTYETKGKQRLVARYQVRDGKLVASATAGERELPEVALDLPAGAVVVGPASAFEFVSHGRLQLAVGAEKVFPSVGFGYPDWKPVVTEVRLVRLPDTELELGGRKHAARHYQTSFTIPLGQFRGEMWCDADEVPLQVTLKMPFGTIEVRRALD